MSLSKDSVMKNLLPKQAADVYHILLFGETGHGKSTLINYLTNYFRQGTLQNLKIAIPTKHLKDTEGFQSRERDLHDSTKSQTTECYSYDFTKDGTAFHFIDTPGLSDTENAENDDKHLVKIMTAAEKSERLAAIVIVINGTLSRATVNMRNTLVRMKGSLPDALLNNLVVVFTNCTAASSNFDLSSLHPWKVPDKNVFYMQNSALSKAPSEWRNNERVLKVLQKEWDSSMQEMEQMIQRVKQLGCMSTEAFRVMREKREKIKAHVHECLLEVKKLQSVQNALENAKEKMDGIESDIKKYSDFKTTKEVSHTELKDTDQDNVLCMRHDDKRCSKAHLGDKIVEFAQGFLGIPAKSLCDTCGFECGVCGCGRISHYIARKVPVQVKEVLEEILEDVKTKYDESKEKQSENQSHISCLQSDLTMLTNALARKEKEIKQCCIDLKEICSQFNFVAELKSVIDTMEANKNGLTSVHARKEADKMIENITRLVDDLTAQRDNEGIAHSAEAFVAQSDTKDSPSSSGKI